MDTKQIEDLEKFEKLVRNYVVPHYFPDYQGDNPKLEKYINDKVLYYMKLGLTNADMEEKLRIKAEKNKEYWEKEKAIVEEQNKERKAEWLMKKEKEEKEEKEEKKYRKDTLIGLIRFILIFVAGMIAFLYFSR